MKREERAVFLLSMGVALMVLILLLGFATVDFQGRRISLGDSTPPLQVFSLPEGGTGLEIKLMGMDKQFDITTIKKVWDMLLDFACIPRKIP